MICETKAIKVPVRGEIMSIIGRYKKTENDVKTNADAKICPMLCAEAPRMLTPKIESLLQRIARSIKTRERSPPAMENTNAVTPPPKREERKQREMRIANAYAGFRE